MNYSYHYDAKTGKVTEVGREELDAFLEETAPPRRPSWWQRLWPRSPYFWLFFMVSTGYSLTTPRHDWLTWATFIVVSLAFFQRANERWGKP